MTAIGRALMARPSMILLDEPSMGLAPQVVEEIFGIVHDLNGKEGVSFLLAEQNTNIALKYAKYGYILENGRVVMDGEARSLRENEDVKEFYLGLSTSGRRSFRDAKFLSGAGCCVGSPAPTVRSIRLALVELARGATCQDSIKSSLPLCRLRLISSIRSSIRTRGRRASPPQL